MYYIDQQATFCQTPCNDDKLFFCAVVIRYHSLLPTSVTQYFTPRSGGYAYTALSTFSSQISSGLSSNTFDIEANVRDGDSRAGLDAEGAAEVAEIMRRERVKCVDRDCGLLWLQENVITD